MTWNFTFLPCGDDSPTTFPLVILDSEATGGCFVVVIAVRAKRVVEV